MQSRPHIMQFKDFRSLYREITHFYYRITPFSHVKNVGLVKVFTPFVKVKYCARLFLLLSLFETKKIKCAFGVFFFFFSYVFIYEGKAQITKAIRSSIAKKR